jgi:formylglycine-generating enzyme
MKTPQTIFAALITSTLTVHAATLPASEDTSSAAGKLTLTANKATTLPVNGSRRAFIFFDLGDLPEGAQLRYARLRFYLPSIVRVGSGLTLHRVTGQWAEASGSAEPAFDASSLATFPAASLGAKRFVSVDVTATVQGWLTAPASNEGFAVAANAGTSAALIANVALGSKEGSGSGYPAELDVELVSTEVVSGAIGTDQLATGAVQTANIATGAVGSGQLAQNLTLAGTTSGTFSGDGSNLSVLNVAAVGTASVTANFMPWVSVGNPGNVADGTTLGTVLQPFKMGKYEVTNAQYAAFLNAVAENDDNELFSLAMGTDPRGGISRAGVAGSYSYSTRKAMADKPVNFVTWYDCIRFANWMHNRMPSGAQGPATTEDGAYTITGNGPAWTVGARNAVARVWLPNQNEWYKAAYYDPARNNGAGGYWLYPMQADTPPSVADGSADAIGALRFLSLNIANINFVADWNGMNGNVTTVGSGGPGSMSAYGAADMGGNVWEWLETVLGPNSRDIRGSCFNNSANFMRSTDDGPGPPGIEFDGIGFRVAATQ